VGILLGCAGVPTDPRPRARIGQIEITFDEARFGARRANRFGELDGYDRMAAALGAAARRARLHSPEGTLTLRADIAWFRLRSSQSAFWLGLFAGSDKLGARVRVERDGELLASFAVKRAKTGSTNVERSSGYRFVNLSVEVANEVVQQLVALDLRDP
jgi:hypothetical protein